MFWSSRYEDYLEDVKYRDIADVTLKDAKEEIMSYEEFASLKEAEKEMQEHTSDIVDGRACFTSACAYR